MCAYSPVSEQIARREFGRHDVLLGSEESRVLGYAGDEEVGDGTLGFGCAVHVDDVDVRSEGLETVAITLGENVSNEEGVEKRRDLSCCLSREQLTHSGCKVSDSDFVFCHPFRESSWSTDIFSGRDVQLSTEEQGGEH